ncbi:MAG: hypothetical protein EBZ14_00505 [Gammaproteobacteria bacterium]|nr:hypothetical protein [Gammaproteobacteria bacterium]
MISLEFLQVLGDLAVEEAEAVGAREAEEGASFWVIPVLVRHDVTKSVVPADPVYSGFKLFPRTKIGWTQRWVFLAGLSQIRERALEVLLRTAQVPVHPRKSDAHGRRGSTETGLH